ncbi:hypothetical protein C2G38_2188306 [Gigaspora rosea]|uniref:Uncharacterized protein n=1 Tax=Gigaspora rosea TaxID=44941 RepID=A0A397VCQ6_9GLOM|nr:hypothetical protein C2G38_2188306 [Gigaspora rosea]
MAVETLGHFFVEKEDSDTVSDALKIIKKIGRNWKPRYILATKATIALKKHLNSKALELPKFSKSIEQLKTPEDYWIHLLKEAFDEDEPPKEAPREIQEAYGIINISDSFITGSKLMRNSKLLGVENRNGKVKSTHSHDKFIYMKVG